MKKSISVLLFTLVALAVSARSGRDIYNQYSEEKDVSAVYISKSMFRLMGRLPEVEMSDENLNLTELIQTLNGFYLIECHDNTKVKQSLADDVDRFVKTSGYEILMEVKEDGRETVRMHTLSQNDEVTGLVMTVTDNNSFTFIFIDGKISHENLEKVARLTSDS